MLILLHGPNLATSRRELVRLKKDYPSEAVSTLEVADFDGARFQRISETPSLLTEKRLIVIEGDLERLSKDQPRLAELLPKLPAGVDVIFWSSGALKANNRLFKTIKELRGQIKLFSETIPQHVFGLLDALGFRNSKKALIELHRLLERGEAPLYLLTMLSWQWRNLLRVKLSGRRAKGINPFVLRKTFAQAKNYSEAELIQGFRALLRADLALKTDRLDPLFILDRLLVSLLSGGLVEAT